MAANLNKNPETTKHFGTFFHKKIKFSLFSFIIKVFSPIYEPPPPNQPHRLFHLH